MPFKLADPYERVESTVVFLVPEASALKVAPWQFEHFVPYTTTQSEPVSKTTLMDVLAFPKRT